MDNSEVNIWHHFGHNLYAKQMNIPRGMYVVKHTHDYDHLSILASGFVTVEIGETKKDYVAPFCITIKAGQEHKIIAQEDSVWFCIHSTDEDDPDKVDEVLIREN